MAAGKSEMGTRLGVWNSRHRDGYRYFIFLGAMGNEQRRGMDSAGGKNEPALDGYGFDRGTGPDRKSNSHFDLYPNRQLRDLSGARQSFSAHAAAQNRHRAFYYRALICCDHVDSGPDRRGTEAEHQ